MQSDYLVVILDHSLECLCPECFPELEVLVPPDSGWSDAESKDVKTMIEMLADGDAVKDGGGGGVDFVKFDDEFLFDSLRDVRLSLGMPYYDQDYQLQYDTGIYNGLNV